MTNDKLLYILQLASPALPVGAYSYSEGLEVLVETGAIACWESLRQWLRAELRYGAISIEAAVMLRALWGAAKGDKMALSYWNAWVAAAKETEELRQQSWQMGRSLSRLLREMQPELKTLLDACGTDCHYPIAFGIAAYHWQISPYDAILGYLHSWATNLITAGVKLIPLGQTRGQKLLLDLHSDIAHATQNILSLEDDDLCSCSWGLALASMAHETQYMRLFRS
ncbi:MAG: urease accessory protein UreF [Hormoscilla sp. SP5CHS1]|nr:urease accessory protein UreF [Hormoscilla sp. SP5CHS1]